jgi:hypothetical protein
LPFDRYGVINKWCSGSAGRVCFVHSLLCFGYLGRYLGSLLQVMVRSIPFAIVAGTIAFVLFSPSLHLSLLPCSLLKEPWYLTRYISQMKNIGCTTLPCWPKPYKLHLSVFSF